MQLRNEKIYDLFIDKNFIGKFAVLGKCCTKPTARINKNHNYIENGGVKRRMTAYARKKEGRCPQKMREKLRLVRKIFGKTGIFL